MTEGNMCSQGIRVCGWNREQLLRGEGNVVAATGNSCKTPDCATERLQ